jgi:hypothetical protein
LGEKSVSMARRSTRFVWVPGRNDPNDTLVYVAPRGFDLATPAEHAEL